MQTKGKLEKLILIAINKALKKQEYLCLARLAEMAEKARKYNMEKLSQMGADSGLLCVCLENYIRIPNTTRN